MRDDTKETSETVLKLLIERDKHLINELERINACLVSVKKDYSDFKQCFNNLKLDVSKEVAALKLEATTDITTLKVKVSNQTKLYGAIGGALVLCTGILAWIIKSG